MGDGGLLRLRPRALLGGDALRLRRLRIRGPWRRGGLAAWGPGGWAATSGNVYQHWGSTSAVSRTSAGYNAWTGNAWSSKVGTSYNSTTGRISPGQGGSATYGNAYTGAQGSAKWGEATGPGGQTHGAAEVNNNVYADHNGNVYKYNTQTQSAQKYSNGSWSNVPKEQVPPSVHSQQAAKTAGDSRSAGASRGSQKWGSGFDHTASTASPSHAQLSDRRHPEDGKEHPLHPAMGREPGYRLRHRVAGDEDYRVPFKFTGKLNKITLTIDRPKLAAEDVKKLEGARRNNRVSE